MKIALVDLCGAKDFREHKSYVDSMAFLAEEGIDFEDYASGLTGLDAKIEGLNKALASDADLVWVMRGGFICIDTLDRIDWEKVVASGKKFYGLSDFTHFSTVAVPKGVTCYYGQGLSHIKEFFPTEPERKFIADFLKTGIPVCTSPEPLACANAGLDIAKEKIIGGHLLIFTLMESQLEIDLKDRYLFLEYHTGTTGNNLEELGYYFDQLLYVLKKNLPKGFVLGHTSIKGEDGSFIPVEVINDFCSKKLSALDLPAYYLDHYKNTVTLR